MERSLPDFVVDDSQDDNTREKIIVTRYDRDTNNDGVINPDDQPNLWNIVIQKDDGAKENPSMVYKYSSSSGDASLAFQEIQLLPSLYYDYQPVNSRDGKIYFISRRSGDRQCAASPGRECWSQKHRTRSP